MTRDELITELRALPDEPSTAQRSAEVLLLMFLVEEGYTDVAIAYTNCGTRAHFTYGDDLPVEGIYTSLAVLRQAVEDLTVAMEDMHATLHAQTLPQPKKRY